MADRTKMRLLGPGRITLDGVDVGYVSQVKIEFPDKQVEAKTAAYGEQALDTFKIGGTPKLTAMFDEISMANYAKVINGMTRNTSGSNENISYGSFVGGRVTAMLLTYIPIDSAIATILSFTAWRVVPAPNAKSLDLGIDKTQALQVELLCLVDESKTDGDKVLRWGVIAVAPDAVAPTATYVPTDGATGQSVAVAPVITFNKAMDPASINVNTILMFTALETGVQVPVAGTVSLDTTGAIATFTPTSSLAGATQYNIIVTTGCKSASGVAFAGAKTDFTTT